jgi:uncharacterized heparinase superfamily protein
VTTWESAASLGRLVVRHTGYLRLSDPVRCERELTLDRKRHALTIVDRFEASGAHSVTVPLHLSPGVRIERSQANAVTLCSDSRRFCCTWSTPQAWELTISQARVSPSYGRVVSAVSLRWAARWGGSCALEVSILPEP